MESLKIRDKKQAEEALIEEIPAPKPVQETPKAEIKIEEETVVQVKEEPKVQPQKVKSSKLTFGQTILEKVKKFFEEVE
jgi:cell division protein FtsA